MDKKTGYVFALTAGMMWAVSSICGQYLNMSFGISAEYIVVIRLIFAGLILLIAGVAGGKNIFAVFGDIKSIAGILLFAFFGCIVTQYSHFKSVLASNAATATVISYISIIITVVYASIRKKRLPDFVQNISVFMVLAGTFILSTHGNINSLYISKAALIWGIVNAASFSFYTIFPARLINKYGSITVIGWGFFLGGIVFQLITRPPVNVANWSIKIPASLIVMVLLGTVMAFYMYSKSSLTVGPDLASVLITDEVIVAALLTWLIFKERFYTMDFIGSFCIVIPTIILTKHSAKDRHSIG